MSYLFEDILIDLLRREGGFVNDPVDRGGATNMGVTIHTLIAHGIDVDGDGDIDVDDVKQLEFSHVKKIYRDKYWIPSKAEHLLADVQPIYFDMVVHHGPNTAARILQKAAGIKADGIVGPVTIAHSFKTPVKKIVGERILFLAGIVHADRSQHHFWHGWLNRALEFLNL
jgi:lysozyme family protein